MAGYKEFPLISPQTCYIDDVSTLKTTSIVANNNIYDVVGATSKNNGNVGFCNKKDLLIDGNCICLIKTGEGSVGEAVYKFGKFIPSNNVAVIRSKYLSKNIGLYIVAAINKNADRYNYGYIRNYKRILKEKIMLPVNSKGEPDYEFMEKYIKERETKLKNQYKKHIKNINDKLHKKINTNKKWQEFYISEIFEIKSGKRLTKADMISGKTPFIGATDNGNGVTNYISNINDSLDKNVLGVNYDGNGVAISFYHPYKCLFTDSVKRFHLKNCGDNKYILLFMKSIILKQKSKYMYGYKFCESRMIRQKIMLPVNSKGEPDYEFMEGYMKHLEQKKLLEYFDYIK